MKEATDATLTKTERNCILGLVNESGPPANEFVWSTGERHGYLDGSGSFYTVSILTHRPTGYYCIFGGENVTICPGVITKVEDIDHEDKWSTREKVCAMWLGIVRQEAEAPDLWASIAQETALPKAAASPTLDNRLFTLTERSLITTRLDDIKAQVLEGQMFATEEAETIEREFAHLRESSERLGRKDWLNNLLGGLVGLAITLALDPARSRGILRLAGEAFQSLWDMAAGYLH
jgi:hypothetical protein